MKNLILLEHYYSPSELEAQVRVFVDYYNHNRYHEALNNVTQRMCIMDVTLKFLNSANRLNKK